MKVELVTYEHRTNGLALFVIPETDEERVVLQGLWKHGELRMCNGVADGTEQGFGVHWQIGDKEETV